MSIFKSKPRRSFISEPINIVTGSLGSGKTLFAIEQADLLRQHGDAKVVYQVGINEPDLRKLPALPFPLDEWHIHADKGELDGAVIIVDEFHKWMPQRSQGSRPPKFVEEMAEARRRGVRFILITQSSEFDHFLKGTRLNRHFYLSRKSGLSRSTIHEWMNRFVADPEANEKARKEAMVHLGWRHPHKAYGDWYVSAQSHHFRPRIPLRLMLVPPFLVALVWFGYQAITVMGGMIDPEKIVPAAQASTPGQTQPSGERGVRPVLTEAGPYLAQFNPVVPTMPNSAPAFQARPVRAEPELYCVIGGEGLDVNGDAMAASCRCYTEQMTEYVLEEAFCRKAARHGIYNPYRAPYVASAKPEAGAATDGRQGSVGAAAVGAAPAISTPGSVMSAPQISGYGDLAVSSPQY